MKRKVLIILILIIFITLPELSGCNSKSTSLLWETSHWEKIKDGYIDAIVIDSNDNNIVYVVTVDKTEQYGFQPDKVWKSEDGGNHWEEDQTEKIEDIYNKYRLSLHGESDIFIDPSNSKIILKQSNSFVERSEDSGKSWEKVISGSLIIGKNQAIIYCVNNSGNIYLSLDFGKTWRRTSLPPISYVPSVNTFSIAVDPQNPNILYVGSPSGLFKSAEGRGDYEYYNISDASNISYLYFDPQNSNLLYAVSINDIFMTFKSSDSDGTWQKLGDFYFNPLHPDVLLKLVITETIPSLSKKLYVSLDGGNNWKLTDLDLIQNGIYSITMGDKGVIYMETWLGLFKSEDKGLHWSQITNFRENYWQVTDGNSNFNSRVLVNPYDPEIIYWAAELMKSVDGGKTWHDMNVIQSSERLHGSTVTIDPHDHNLVYIGITGTVDIEIPLPEDVTRQGIYMSRDGGRSWEKIGLDGYRVSAIAISPATGTIYAGTYYNGLFKSVDSGKTWERIELDKDFHISISSLAVDTKNNVVYIGILDGGVFEIEDRK